MLSGREVWVSRYNSDPHRVVLSGGLHHVESHLLHQHPRARGCCIGMHGRSALGAGLYLRCNQPGQRSNTDAPIATITVRSPANANDVLQLTATAINRVGNARSDVPIKFTSSDPSVATVDSAGVLHALKSGTVTVKASTCGQSASSQITIVPAAIAIQTVAAAAPIVAEDSVLVTARALDQTGASLAGVKFVFQCLRQVRRR